MSNHEPALFGWQSARTAKVFYVIFVDEQIVPPHNPAALDSDDDGTVGCISWSQIPPPHTVNALKRAICRAEQITEPTAYEIYKTFIDAESLHEAQRLILISGQYPGVDPNEPVVLVNKRSIQDVIGGNLSSSSAITSVPDNRDRENTLSNIVSGQEMIQHTNTFLGHNAVVNAVAFSPDGSLLASASADNTVRIFNTTSATLVSHVQGHTDSVRVVTFSPDGTQIATASDDKTARIWNVMEGTCERTLQGYKYGIRSIVFSPNASRVFMEDGKCTFDVYDLSSQMYIGTLDGNGNCMEPISFSPDGSLVVCAMLDNSLQTCEVESTARKKTFYGHTAYVTSVAWSPNGLLLVSGSGDNTIRVWDSLAGVLLATMQEPSSKPVLALSFSLDGSSITSVGWRIGVWNLASGALLRSMYLQGNTSSVQSYAISRDRSILATGCQDGSVRTWRIA